MKEDYWKIYHKNSKKTGTYIPADIRDWRREWIDIEHKRYPRLERILLPQSKKVNVDLFDTIVSRKSGREFTQENISLEILSTLLHYSVGCSEKANHLLFEFQRRMYPSAGHRFPVETYVVSTITGSELNAGVYHYAPKEHMLEKIKEVHFTEDIKKKLFNEKKIYDAPLYILMTGVFDRTIEKYGERGYRFVLMESGHMAQNFYLVSSALGLNCCSIGGSMLSDSIVEEFLDIDGSNESLIYRMVFG